MEVVTSSLQLYLNAATASSYPDSGTEWYDLSANAYTASLVGSDGDQRPTYNITHFTFNNGEYVNTNQSLASETFSVGAWFRTDAGGTKMILSKETTAGNPWNYRIWLNGGQIIADMAQGATQSSLASPLNTYNDNQWHLVMFTRNDSNWYLYVDGVQINTKLDSYVGSVTNSQELWIGQSAYLGGSYQYVGDIGQVFIYDRVLDSSEILQNFEATEPTYYPSTTPTPTVTPTSTSTPAPTPTITPSPTTVYPEICIKPLHYTSTDFPLWRGSTFILNEERTEKIYPCGQSLSAGDIVQLSASQVYYSFDYYAIYPPHTIYSAGAFWYTTVKGFTASYDPNTIVKIGATVNITGSDAGIRAIYR